MKIPFILFFIALSIRIAVIFYWQFDGLYGQDAYAYFDQAVAITQNLPHGQPPPTNFFWPNGYPLLIAFFSLFVGQTAWAGQLASLLSGAALAPLTFLLSRDLFRVDNSFSIRKHQGILAGLIIAVAGQPILSSVVIMADMPALVWATLAAWVVVRAGHFQGSSSAGCILSLSKKKQGKISLSGLQLFSPSASLFLAAGAAMALAIISRWLYALLVPALGFYVIFTYWETNPGLSLRRKARLAFPGLWAVFSGALILAPQLWLSLNQPAGLAHTFLLGWSPLHFWQRQFENTEGHFSYLLPMAIYYAQPAGHPAYIFPLLGLASLWAIWRLGQTRQWASLILLLGWAGPVYLFLAGISFQNFRFGLTLYLPLILLADYGLSDLLSRSKISTAALKAVIVLSLLGMLAWAYPMLDNFLTAQNQSKVIAHQVEQTLPVKATLITFGLTLTLQHYTALKTVELFYLDETSLKSLSESTDPLYLLLDLESIQTQWQGKIPQVNYQWLKENKSLTEIGSFPPYVLFRVSTPK